MLSAPCKGSKRSNSSASKVPQQDSWTLPQLLRYHPAFSPRECARLTIAACDTYESKSYTSEEPARVITCHVRELIVDEWTALGIVKATVNTLTTCGPSLVQPRMLVAKVDEARELPINAARALGHCNLTRGENERNIRAGGTPRTITSSIIAWLTRLPTLFHDRQPWFCWGRNQSA